MLRCNNTDNFTWAKILTRIQGDVQGIFEERTAQLKENKKMQEMHWETAGNMPGNRGCYSQKPY